MKPITEIIQEVYASFASGKPIGQIEDNFSQYLKLDNATRAYLVKSILANKMSV